MRKILIIAVAALMVTACGNKTKGGEVLADSTIVDSLALVADSVQLEYPDQWTVEAVEGQIRACFEEVNRMSDGAGIDISRLDSMFCSEDFLQLQANLYKKVRESKGEVMFDGDEGYHWLAGLGTPIKVDSVKGELLTGEMAQAEVWLTDEHKNKAFLELNLYLENGIWKIHNWEDTDVYPFGGLFQWMQNIFDGHTNPDEIETGNLNNYAE